MEESTIKTIDFPALLPDLIAETLKADNGERRFDIIRRRFGLNRGKEYTLEDIGQIYDISRERVRQIEARAIEHLQKALLVGDYRRLARRVPMETIEETRALQVVLRSLRDIDLEDNIVKTICERYGRSPSSLDLPSIRVLLTIYGLVQLTTTSQGQSANIHKAWIVKPPQDSKQMSKALRAITKTLKKTAIKLPYPDLKIAVNRQTSERYRDVELQTALYLSADIEHLEDDTYQIKFHLLPNRRDMAYRILWESGRALHIRDIASELNHRLALAGQHGKGLRTIATQVSQDKRFAPVGHSGEWCLTEWPDIVTADILDLMVQFFNLGQVPLTPKEVYEYVKQSRSVKYNSVRIYLDNNQNFKKVGPGLYALSLWDNIPTMDKIEAKKKDTLKESIIEAFKKQATNRMPLADLVRAVGNELGIPPDKVYGSVSRSRTIHKEPMPSNPFRKIAVLVPKQAKPASLRSGFERSVIEVLNAAPGHSMLLPELKRQVLNRIKVNPHTFYRYLSEIQGIKKTTDSILRTTICSLSGEEFVFPQTAEINDTALQEELRRAVSLLNIDYVDLGLFTLGKLFESTVREYLNYAREKQLFLVSSKDLGRLVDMVNALGRNNVISDETTLNVLRVERNARAHGSVPSIDERKAMLRSAPFFAGMYIDTIALLRTKIGK